MQIDPVSSAADISVQARKLQVQLGDVKSSKPIPELGQKPEKGADKHENISRIQSTLSESKISLRFHTDDRTNRIIVDVVDEITGESVMQIPSEVSLKLAADFIDMQRNFLDRSN